MKYNEAIVDAKARVTKRKVLKTTKSMTFDRVEIEDVAETFTAKLAAIKNTNRNHTGK